MTDQKSPSSPGNAQEDPWRCLAESVLLGSLDHEHLGLTEIIQALHAFNVPTAFQERLKTALIGAVAQADERNRQPQRARLVLIRLWMAQHLEASRESESDRDSPPDRPSALLNLTDSLSLGGWGFFLVERGVDELSSASKVTHAVIELFLYREGERVVTR